MVPTQMALPLNTTPKIYKYSIHLTTYLRKILTKANLCQISLSVIYLDFFFQKDIWDKKKEKKSQFPLTSRGRKKWLWALRDKKHDHVRLHRVSFSVTKKTY